MCYEKYIGFKLDELLPILECNNLKYTVIETFDTKKTILGDEKRIVKIINEENIKIFVAYF